MALRKGSASGQIYRGAAPPPPQHLPGNIDQDNVAIFLSEHEAAKSNRLFTAPAAGGRRSQRVVWLGCSQDDRSSLD